MKGFVVMPDTPELSEAKHALLEKYLRREIPRAATVANVITKLTKTEVTDPRESVVPIQRGGSKRPFFFLHGDWVNGAYWCFSLARDLGADQPFYALEPYTFDGLRVPPTIETMAAAHLRSLRSVQPEGPYLLGGFCNGGLLAYEMARQLHTEGQTVDLLVLMDPMGLIYPIRTRLARGLVSCLCALMRLDQEKQVNLFILLRHLYNYLLFSHYRQLKDSESRGTNEQSKHKNRPSKVRSILTKLNAIFPPVEILRQDDSAYSPIYDWSAMRYVPPSLYPGKITFFWDSEEPWRRAGWRRAAETNEIEVHIIPGTQMGSRTQHLPILAEHLRVCLSKVQVAE
jgi:hypothetical protein